MSFKLTSITQGVNPRPPRIVLYGGAKLGKSTWAAGAPSPVFIPIKAEEGLDFIDTPKFPVCSILAEVMDALQLLATEDHQFKTVVIDSASALEPVIHEAVCEEYNVKSIELAGGGFGKGTVFAHERWREVMAALDYLRDEKDMISIIIGHSKVKSFNDPERPSYDRHVIDLNEKVASSIFRWADFLGYAGKNIGTTVETAGFNKKIVKGVDLDEETNYLFTRQTAAHAGGGRGVYGQLPSEIPLNWKSFQEEVDSLLKLAKKVSKK